MTIELSEKRFRIHYVNPRRPEREVSAERFERSSAFYPVLLLDVGGSISGRYRSAGYARITRIA